MKSVMQEYDELKGWKRILHKLWCLQHMVRVKIYRLTGVSFKYRWARRIGTINMVPLSYCRRDAEVTYELYKYFNDNPDVGGVK